MVWKLQEEADWDEFFEGKFFEGKKLPVRKKFDFFQNLAGIIEQIQSDVQDYHTFVLEYVKLLTPITVEGSDDDPFGDATTYCQELKDFIKSLKINRDNARGTCDSCYLYDPRSNKREAEVSETSNLCNYCYRELLQIDPYTYKRRQDLRFFIFKQLAAGYGLKPYYYIFLGLEDLIRFEDSTMTKGEFDKFQNTIAVKLLSKRLGLPEFLFGYKGEDGFHSLLFQPQAASNYANLLQLLRRYHVISRFAYKQRYTKAYAGSKKTGLYKKTTPGIFGSHKNFAFPGLVLGTQRIFGKNLYQAYLKFGWAGVEAIFRTRVVWDNSLRIFVRYLSAGTPFKELVKFLFLLKQFKNLGPWVSCLTCFSPKVLRVLPKTGVAGRLAAALLHYQLKHMGPIVPGLHQDPSKTQETPISNRIKYDLWLKTLDKLRYSSENLSRIQGLKLNYESLCSIYSRTTTDPENLDKFVKAVASLGVIAKELGEAQQLRQGKVGSPITLGEVITANYLELIPHLAKLAQKIHHFVQLTQKVPAGFDWTKVFSIIQQGVFPEDKHLLNPGALIEWTDANYWKLKKGDHEVGRTKQALREKIIGKLEELRAKRPTKARFLKRKTLIQELESLDRDDALARIRDRLAQQDPSWAVKEYPKEYQDGKFLAPLYLKIFEALNKIPGPLVIHGRDGETLYQAAKAVDMSLYSRMIYVLSSRPLTTDVYEHSAKYLAYLNNLIDRNNPMVHVDTGFSGSIPHWFRSKGWQVKDIKLISSNNVEYGLLGNESLSTELRATVLDKIEHIKHRLIQATPDIWGQWLFNYDAPAFWSLVQGIVDGIQELTAKISQTGPVRPNPASEDYSLQKLYELHLT